MDIWRRFKAAWDFTTEGHGAKKSVLKKCDIPESNFNDAINRPDARRLKIEWVAAVCVELGISTQYVMTGKGKMFN